MRWLTITVLVLALLWGGWWIVGSQAETRATAAFFAARRAAGWTASYNSLEIAGFPSRFDLTLKNPALGDPRRGYVWRAPFAQILALSYNPYHFIAALPGDQRIATPKGEVRLTATRMRGSLSFVPGLALTLNEAVLIADAPALNLPPGPQTRGWRWRADQLRLGLRRAATIRNGQELGVEVDGLVPDPAEKARLDPEGALPARIGRIHLDATLGLDRPLDRHAAKVAPHLRELAVKTAGLDWGGMQLRASGTVTVAPDGTPEGRIDLTLRDWHPLVVMAVQLGLLRREIAPTVTNMLDALAKGSGDPGTVDLPVDFHDGLMSVGPLPLGPAPRLSLTPPVAAAAD